ncbi:MAG: nucleotidyltransferase [Dorea sp.]|jgi:cytidyltransferase-like protein|nr:nucleotidyltransferase [Dorea sp.]
MKIVGLITEYNPFHNGHLYHIEKAKEITGADFVIVVMSGNYVQRGAPAIMPKHLRAEVALEAGVDILMELPVCYAVGSAEYFAAGAIDLLEQLGCVDSICFGSECGDYGLLARIAHILADEPEGYKQSLKEALKTGRSFPLARQIALKEYLQDDTLDLVLEQPNNILGIEYIKALYQRHSSMKSYTIKRMVSGYHDSDLSSSYSSASAIRRLLSFTSQSVMLEKDGMFDEPSMTEVLSRLEGQVPPSCIRMLEETHHSRYPVYTNDFSLLLKYRLLTETRQTLTTYLDISEELANRIINNTNDFISFDQFSDQLKTRDMTLSRICRCLFHILLNIRTEDLLAYQQAGYCQYARILGFRKDARRLLTLLKNSSNVPLITKLAQTENLSATGLSMLKTDIFAANLYESLITNKYKMPFINEYQQQILRI